MSLKVVFAGTPNIAVPTLKALVASEHQVLAVLTQPDRPAGRGRHLTASPIKAYAQTQSLAVYQPERLDKAIQLELNHWAPDIIVVVAYGLLIPKSVLALPKRGCINVHFSLLPRWRGASPIQYTLLSGDKSTGITIMQLDEGLDTGPILLQESYPVELHENAKMLEDRLATKAPDLLLSTLSAIEKKTLYRPLVQKHADALYAPKINKSQGLIHWQRTAKEIANQVRALNPRPVAFTYFQGKRLRIWQTQVVDASVDLLPGTVVAVSKQGIEVATTDKIIRILALQLPGGRTMTAAEFLNAHPIVPGDTVFSNEGAM